MIETLFAMGLLGAGVIVFSVTLKPQKNLTSAQRKNSCNQLAATKLNYIRGNGIGGVISKMNSDCSSSCPCSDTESTSDLANYEVDAEEFLYRIPNATRETHYEILNIRTLNTDCTKVTTEVGKDTGYVYRVRVYVTYQDSEPDDSLVTKNCELSETFTPTEATTSTSTIAACMGYDEACTDHADCCSPRFCHSATSTCQNCVGSGNYCESDDWCCGALTCQSNFCAN